MSSVTADQARPVRIRPALLADLPAVLRIRQAQEFADSGASVSTADQLTAEWHTLGPRLAELQSGFLAISTYEQMELALDSVPESPPAIAGVEIRPFVGGRDEEAVVYRADEEAFLDERGYTPRTFDQWRRRLHLGLALTCVALDSFYRQGIDTARLNVDAQSLTGAHQLYRRLGFLVRDTYSNFEKIVQIAGE
jgi:hypothetical protein